MKKHFTRSISLSTLALCAALLVLPVSAMAGDPTRVFRPEALQHDGPVVEAASAVGGMAGGVVGLAAGAVIGAPVGAVVGALQGNAGNGMALGFMAPVVGLGKAGAYAIGGPVWMVKKLVYDAPREAFRAATAG